MSELQSLNSFLKSVQAGSFSAAASQLGITPAAVSKHVAKLERDLGVRLFRRTTRSLTLTEAGERFYAETAAPAKALNQAMNNFSEHDAQPSGTLKISVAPGFGRQYVLPLMPEFLARYPAIKLDWSFENRHVDLVAEGFDAAIGSGMTADANVVARLLMPINLLTVGAPAYFAQFGAPSTLTDLSHHECLRLRSATTGRIRDWTFKNQTETVTVPVQGRVILTDLEAICDATLAGMGLARLGAHHVLPFLEDGRLVQVLEQHSMHAGSIHVYYAHYNLTPPKVRAFVDFLAEQFGKRNWGAAFSNS